MALETVTTLQAVFEKADTPANLKHWLLEVLEIKRIADLVSYVQKSTYEKEWLDMVCGAFPVVEAREARQATEATEGVAAQPARPAVEGLSEHKQRILVARMRQTYKIALGVEQAQEDDVKKAKEDTYQADMEQPLDPETRKRLRTSWSGIHPWNPVPSMKAGPKFRNRVVREFLGACVTNHPVEKAVSSLQVKRPMEPERLPIGPASAVATLIYEREKPQTRTVSTLLEYFSCLRLIMGTYAYCGTHQVESKVAPGTRVVFFPWENALGYADDSMNKVLEISIPEADKLRWIRKRDEKTRATMAHLINEGYPGGEAIEAAVAQHAHYWDMEDRTVAADTESTLAALRDAEAAGSYVKAPRNQAPRGQKRQQPEGKGNPGRKEVKLAREDSKRRKICGPWNGKKGCWEPCRNREQHVCNVIAADGKACAGRFGKPGHNALQCPIAKR